jgi:hypothetical protein
VRCPKIAVRGVQCDGTARGMDACKVSTDRAQDSKYHGRDNVKGIGKRRRAAKCQIFGTAENNQKLEWISKALAIRLCKPLSSHGCTNDGGRSNKDEDVSLQLTRTSIGSANK